MLRVYKGNIYDLAYVSAQVILDTTSIPKIAGADFVEINGTKAPINAQIDGELSVPTYIHLFNFDNLGTRKIKFYFDKQVSLYPWYNPLVGDEIKSSFDPVEQCYVFEINANSPIIRTFGDLEVVFLVGTDCTLYRVSVFDPKSEYHRDFGKDFYRTIDSGFNRLMINGVGGLTNPYLCFKTNNERIITVKQYGRGYAETVDQLTVQADENGFYKARIQNDAWHIELYDNDQPPSGDEFEFTFLSVHENSTQAPKFEYFDDFLSAEVIEEKKILSDDLPIDCFNAEFYADEGETLSLSVGDKLTLVSNDNVFGRFTIKTVERTYAGTYQVVAYNKFYELDNIPFYGQQKSFWQMTDRTTNGVTEKGINSYFADIGVDIDTSAIYWQGGESIGLTGYVPANSVRYFVCALAYAHNKFITIDRESEKITLESLLASKSGLTIPYIHNYEDLDDPTNNVEKIIGEATFERQNLGRGSWSYGYIKTSEEFNEFKTNIELDEQGNGKIYVFGGKDAPKHYSVDNWSTATMPFVVLWRSDFALVIQSTANATITVHSYDISTQTETIRSSQSTENEVYSLDKFGCVGYTNERITAPYFTPVDRIVALNRYTNNHGKVMAKIIIDKAHPEKVGDYVKIQTAHDGDKYGYITKMHTMFGYDDFADIEVETYYTS